MSKKLDKKNRISSATTTVASAIIIVYQGAIAEVSASSEADYSFMTTADWRNCLEMGSEYQEVYAFETTNFYVNICQKNNTYFYSGEAKQSAHNSIFIPAYSLNNNRGFQAENGNVSYVVLLPFFEQKNLNSSTKPEEAILTIKRNGRLVSVESSLHKYCQQSETAIIMDEIELSSESSNQLATIPSQQDVGWNHSSAQPRDLLPAEIFNLDSHFDFYRIGGELHRLTTCE